MEKLHKNPINTEFLHFKMINELYGVLYVRLDKIKDIEINSYSYNTLPKCYTYMDLSSQNASGTKVLHDHSYLKLRGKGTAVAIIDSGIDYRNPLFIDKYGSRIRWLWDQTLESDSIGEVPYGRIFRKNEIDKAIHADDPYEIVPSKDENGHGTALAAIAAGNIDEKNGFSGSAPEAEIYIVKLKKAKKYLKDFYLYPSDVDIFQEDDIMFALSQLLLLSRVEGRPLSICIGVGSSQGSHQGESHLSQMIDYISGFSQISISIAAGNEGISKHHYLGKAGDISELKVGKEEKGFVAELWARPPEKFLFAIQSPSGESIEISTNTSLGLQTMKFIFTESVVLVNYIPIELETGNLLIYFRFIKPAPGIWKIISNTRGGEEGEYHIWLPVQRLISEETYFLEPSSSNTITSPADSYNSITVTAYDQKNNSLFYHAGRGYGMAGGVVPQIAAPGVDLRIPLRNQQFGYASGTSYAAAHTAGAAALLLEWALVKENEPFFTGKSVKYYFQKGAVREVDKLYPNKEWGYGRLNLYNTLDMLT